MDELELQYSNQVRTLQHAIKTQNDVLINKIQTVLNQATLETFQTLDLNLALFLKNYRDIRDYQKNDLEAAFINLEYLKGEIEKYANLNLKALREQISNSISGLQTAPSTDPQISSLLDVMQLLLKAADLYSKNLKEAVNLPPAIGIADKFKQIQSSIGGIRDGRFSFSDKEVKGLQLQQIQQLKCDQIFDVFPLLNENKILVATYENELFIYDVSLQSVAVRLESMRFVPCSCLQLQKRKNKQLSTANLILLGGSEFDPNVYLFDTLHGKRIQTFPGHDKSIRYLVQLGDVNTFVSLGRDSKMFFWNLIKGDPHQILNIPTIEIIEFQLNVRQQSLYTLSIDGKICIIKIMDNQDAFQKAEIIHLIDLQQTSSLSQMICSDTLTVVSFSSGWLTGQNQLKIFEEIPLQTVKKMKRVHEIMLDAEIYQLNSIQFKGRLIVIAIQKTNGKLLAFINNGDKFDPLPIKQEFVGEEKEQVRWNIKLLRINQQLKVIKHGQDNSLQIYEILY